MLLRSVLHLHHRRITTKSLLNWSFFSTKSFDEDYQRYLVTKKIRTLGLRSNQARQALSLFDDYILREKKRADLKMFAAVIHCAINVKDLQKGKEIHQLIDRDYPELKENLMLKQQLRFLYMKCNDHQSAEKLFPRQSSNDQ